MPGRDSGSEYFIFISFSYSVATILIYAVLVSCFSTEMNFLRCKMRPEKESFHSVATFDTKDNLTAVLSLKLSLNVTTVKVVKQDRKLMKNKI